MTIKEQLIREIEGYLEKYKVLQQGYKSEVFLTSLSKNWQKEKQGDSTALDTIAKNLDVVVDDEPEFAAEVKAIALKYALLSKL